MEHKVKRDAARTAKKILQAATTEFSQKGLSGARVDTIAERAKTNKWMLYQYFLETKNNCSWRCL